MRNFIILLTILCFTVVSCGTDILEDQQWIINTLDVEKSLPEKDDIPALNNPQYKTLEEVDYMNDEDLVIIANVDGIIKIYPVKILDYHEVVNETNEVIIYSALTGTSNMWRRIVDGVRLDFGVSGYVHNNNILLYDQTTNSFWSQVLSKSVTGQYINTTISGFNVIETTWATAKSTYSEAPILSDETGFARAYDDYPYGEYREERDLILPFNTDYLDNRLFTKDKVLGILGEDAALAYSYNNLEETGTSISDDVIEGQEIIVIGRKEDNILVAFNKVAGLTYSLSTNGLPALFKDSNDNEYDIFGQVISGPDIGSTLSAPRTMTGYWFMFPAFYSDIEVR